MTTRSDRRSRLLASIGGGLLALQITARAESAPSPSGVETLAPISESFSAGADPGSENTMPDPTAPRIALIPAGTVVASTPPRGWTHLIIKSLPKMDCGDVDQVPETVRRLSGMFFCAMLARVAPPDVKHPRGYRLEEVAINLGTRIGANDTVITPETQARLGADLGFLARIALDRGAERLKGVKVVARTRTMAVIDGPAMMVRDQKHRPVILRYAIMVDPMTGQLETLVWAIAQDDRGAYLGMFAASELLPPNKIADRGMHVDANEFSFGLITENAVALVDLHKGRATIEFPAEIMRLAGQPRFTEASTADLERKLWPLIRSVPAS